MSRLRWLPGAVVLPGQQHLSLSWLFQLCSWPRMYRPDASSCSHTSAPLARAGAGADAGWGREQPERDRVVAVRCLSECMLAETMESSELKGKTGGPSKEKKTTNPLGSSRLDNRFCRVFLWDDWFCHQEHWFVVSSSGLWCSGEGHVENHYATDMLYPNTYPQNILSLGCPSKLNKPQFLQGISPEARDWRAKGTEWLLRAAHEERPHEITSAVTTVLHFRSESEECVGNIFSYLQDVVVFQVSRSWNTSLKTVSWINPLQHHYNTNKPKEKPLAQETLLPFLVNYYHNINYTGHTYFMNLKSSLQLCNHYPSQPCSFDSICPFRHTIPG